MYYYPYHNRKSPAKGLQRSGNDTQFNPNDSADKALDSSATLPQTQDALQADNAERMTPDEANELSNHQ